MRLADLIDKLVEIQNAGPLDSDDWPVCMVDDLPVTEVSVVTTLYGTTVYVSDVDPEELVDMAERAKEGE